MIPLEVKKLLEKQQYEFVGEHSAVKICGWTKKALRGEGVCYKEKFYGLKAHRCVQMSVAVNFCDMDCIYCWRDRNNSPFSVIDEPDEIIEKSILAQRHQLNGFGGNPVVDKVKFEESKEPLHFAISLTGEMTYYPKLGEFLTKLHEKNYTSFLVVNGQNPKVLREIPPPTQFYISLDGVTKEQHAKLCRPMKPNSWELLLESLDVMNERNKDTRTTLRLTMIKGMNTDDETLKGFATLIKRANPLFIEVKAYMFIGASMEKLELKNMPYHEDVRAYAETIAKHSGYKFIDEQESSRVVLLMKEDVPNRIMKF